MLFTKGFRGCRVEKLEIQNFLSIHFVTELSFRSRLPAVFIDQQAQSFRVSQEKPNVTAFNYRGNRDAYVKKEPEPILLPARTFE